VKEQEFVNLIEELYTTAEEDNEEQ